MPLSVGSIEPIIRAFARQRILVVGDLMLDEFVWGKVSRLSPEAPVPVLDVQQTSYYPGGAANVARNLCSFDPAVTLVGAIGRDGAGERLTGLLGEQGINCDAVLVCDDRPTTLKSRFSAITRQRQGELHIEDQQQLVRVDREERRPVTDAQRAALLDRLRRLLPEHDAVIIEDYAKGLIDQDVVDGVVTLAREAGKPVTVDPNPANPLQWRGVTAVKPNRREAFLAAELPYSDEGEAARAAAARLLEKWRTAMLLMTLGEDGMLLCRADETPYHTPTRAKEVFDVSGAGDTAIAAFTLALAGGASGVQAAELANHASGIVVGKLGTATTNAEELLNSFRQHSDDQGGVGA